MRILIDEDRKTISCDGAAPFALYSKEAFEILSALWLKVGWNEKYTYTFSWMGRPVIQLPEDMIRIQEVIYELRPDVVIETGIAHGGSLVFYASLLRAMGHGRVIGVDVEIRPHNRKAIETHELFPLITLIEGSSTDPEIVRRVHGAVAPGDKTLIILDSAHGREHVRKELEAYQSLVSPGSYLIAADGIMRALSDVPRGNPSWDWDNPAQAAAEFAQAHPDFLVEPPAWCFNESALRKSVTYWPGAWLRRRG